MDSGRREPNLLLSPRLLQFASVETRAKDR